MTTDPPETPPCLVPFPRTLLREGGVLRLSPDRSARVHALVETPPRAPREGYTLVVAPGGITVRGNDPAGLDHGLATLRQLQRQYGFTLPCLRIEDHPDYRVRGVLLDISRGKVPTLATLLAMVDFLADLKVNQLQLYMEHTFAYRDHPEVWTDASPLACDEVRVLDQRCRARHVDLVPCQNSFGHMENWLKHPRYRPLAECPDGFTLPWGEWSPEPLSLSPARPGSLELAASLYHELLPCFTGTLFNIGCDETYDVGLGASRELVAARGVGEVYLDFVRALADLARGHGKTPMIWADMLQEHPELMRRLGGDVVCLEWGYERDHDFDLRCGRLANAGLPLYVCPNTGTLNAFEGRTGASRTNLCAAAEAGLRHGAVGYLNTEWGDHGHWQHPCATYQGLARGAAHSWSSSASAGVDLDRAVSLHAFGDLTGTLGELTSRMGELYEVYEHRTGTLLRFSSFLSRILYEPLEPTAPTALLPSAIGDAVFGECLERIRDAEALLSRSRPEHPDAALHEREIRGTLGLARHACHRGRARWGSGDGGTARALAGEMEQILAEHRSLWATRNRPGGLESRSASYFETMLAEYRARITGGPPGPPRGG